MVFSSMEQRLADTAREKVFLLYKAYLMEAKDSRETFRMATNSVFQLAGTGIVKIIEYIMIKLQKYQS